MNELKKKKVKSNFKYTWPFYIMATAVVPLVLYFVFSVVHRTPDYKTLTVFVTGSVVNPKKLENDLLVDYKYKELKSFSYISAEMTDPGYNTLLTVNGYNSADILIIPESKLDKLVLSAFALEFDEGLLSYYRNDTLYVQDNVTYGVRVNKNRVRNYFSLPYEDCYMVLNGKSANIGEYSPSKVKEHDLALLVTKKWGI